MKFAPNIPNLRGRTLAFTGHRPDKLGGYGPKADHERSKLAEYVLRAAKPAKIITGMALGWDMAAAQAAGYLGIPFIAAVPFDGQERKWPPLSQQLYRETIAEAAELVIVSPGTYAVEKMQIRNRWMVDHGDALCALWDGSTGGTRNCLLYATRDDAKDIPIFNVWPLWAEDAKWP